MPVPMTSYGSLTSLDGTPVMTSGRLLSMVSFPYRACAISGNLGGGHGGLWSDTDWSSINFLGGVVGASASAVAHMAIAVGWPLLWVIGRDPLGWALLLPAWLLGDSWGTAFINCCKVISIHGDGTVAMKTSPSVKVSR